MQKFEIVSFYEFKELGCADDLLQLKQRLRTALIDHNVFGTMILAKEGFNASLCGRSADVAGFIRSSAAILETAIEPKTSFCETAPFRKQEVRIKPEIVTLKRSVDLSLGHGTHVDPRDWNEIISDPETLLLDTRNDYEFRTGTFRGAVNPETSKFSDLPQFVETHLDASKHKKIAMFCTGGIRCEKFAPYLKGIGFESVYQLRGGILKYLEEVPVGEQMWDGECFVFDERVSLKEDLAPGSGVDLSQRRKRME